MKRALLAAWMVALAAPLAVASTIDAGNWSIPQATGQTITVVVYSDIAETAKALNFSTSLVNGPGGSTDLLFTALNFDVTGFMWDGATTFEHPWSGSATSANGGDSDNSFADVPIPGTQASPVGLVRVTLDASSAPLGTWDLLLANLEFGPTSWSAPSNGQPTLLSGTITVTPEPTMLAELLGLLGMGGLGLFFRRRKR